MTRTVDGRNPVQVARIWLVASPFIPVFTLFYTSQVVPDFFHQNCHIKTINFWSHPWWVVVILSRGRWRFATGPHWTISSHNTWHSWLTLHQFTYSKHLKTINSKHIQYDSLKSCVIYDPVTNIGLKAAEGALAIKGMLWRHGRFISVHTAHAFCLLIDLGIQIPNVNCSLACWTSPKRSWVSLCLSCLSPCWCCTNGTCPSNDLCSTMFNHVQSLYNCSSLILSLPWHAFQVATLQFYIVLLVSCSEVKNIKNWHQNKKTT